VTVSRSERVWVDAGRTTPRTATYPGAPERTLRTLIWQPTVTKPLPLLLMAHGFGGLPEKFDAFARTVSAAGFVVAAPAFPLTNENTPGGHDSNLRDFLNQPADVSFVLSQLLAANDTPRDPLHGRVRADAVAVLGHSLGGLTTVGLTRKNCCRDSRVAATLLFAPVALYDSFGADPIDAGPPTLIVQGTADPAVNYTSTVHLYDRIDPPRTLVLLAGADHSQDLESQIEPPVPARAAAQQATIAFLRARFAGARAELDATLAALTVAGNMVETDLGS